MEAKDVAKGMALPGTVGGQLNDIQDPKHGDAINLYRA
jgi:hypothetical protein